MKKKEGKNSRKFECISPENHYYERSDLSTGDSVHDYGRHLCIGGLYLEMRDAIREGDGESVTMLAIFVTSLSEFWVHNRSFQTSLSVPIWTAPRLAEQLMWSRSVNTHGVQSKNIPLDFHQNISTIFAKQV